MKIPRKRHHVAALSECLLLLSVVRLLLCCPEHLLQRRALQVLLCRPEISSTTSGSASAAGVSEAFKSSKGELDLSNP